MFPKMMISAASEGNTAETTDALSVLILRCHVLVPIGSCRAEVWCLYLPNGPEQHISESLNINMSFITT